MSAGEHRRAMELFLAAAEVAPEERAAWLDERCGEDPGLRRRVEALLGADESAGGFLAGSALESETRLGALPTWSSAPPETIGRYRIVGELGQGGMGTVFAAEQEKPRRRVALKVLRGLATPDRVARFELESELVGRLQHPGIAQVHEAGTAEVGGVRVPFIAMELIEGAPVTRWADEHGLEPRARLELFARVADAVDHAHRRGVIHRDLKPSNVLVGADGGPKVLDFGVARLVVDGPADAPTLTAAGQVVGTLQCMSPEQLEGSADRVDTRSDVYGLGCILYELLGGRPPLELSGCSLPEAARRIREVEPAPLSRLEPSLAGEVETIAAKALEKDPERRYASAAELAADVRRFLRDEPILAQPPSATYRLRKLARRHRAVALGAAATLVALVLGLVGTTWQAVRARARQVEAEEALATAEAINRYLLRDVLASPVPERDGRQVKVVDVLERAGHRVEEAFADRPRVGASVRHVLGESLLELGVYDEGERHVRAAVSERERVLDPDDPELWRSRALLSDLHLRRGEPREALPLAEAVLAWRAEHLGNDHPETLEARKMVALVLLQLGDLDAGRERLDALLDDCRRVLGADARETLWVAGHSTMWAAPDGLLEAQELAAASRELARARYGEGDIQTLWLAHRGVALLERAGRMEEAEAAYRELLPAYEAAYGAESLYAGIVLEGLASTIRAQGRLEDAREILVRLLELRERALGRAHPDTAWVRHELSRVALARDDPDEAERWARASVELLRAEPAPDLVLVDALNALGRALRVGGQPADAERVYREAIEVHRSLSEEGDARLSQVLYNLGAMLRNEGRDPAAAVEPLREALAIDRRVFGDDDHSVASDLVNLAEALRESGRPEEAEPLYVEVLERWDGRLEPDHRYTLGRKLGLGLCLLDLGRPADAEPWLADAAAGYERTRGPDDESTREAREALARARSGATAGS